MKNLAFIELKKALRKRDRKNYRILKLEIRKIKANIEKFLTMFFESTTSQNQTNYSSLSMY